jgi:hypothetical protein
MKIGTRSLLFGVHQFLWHPITVFLAWHYLYGWPTWKECVCIVCHDWGYWGSPNMDGPEGEDHPRRSALIVAQLFGFGYEHYLVLLHSRHFAKRTHNRPSKLCFADKLSIAYDPNWFYLLRAQLSGEIREYRKMSSDSGFVPAEEPDWVWLIFAKETYIKLGLSMDADSVPYQHSSRETNRN